MRFAAVVASLLLCACARTRAPTRPPAPLASAAPSASGAPTKPPSAATPTSVIELACTQAIASSHDADGVATVFFTLAAATARPPMGRWFVCHGLATDPTVPCLAVEVVDGGGIEARCPSASTRAGGCDGVTPCFWCDEGGPDATMLCGGTPRDCQSMADGRPCTPRLGAICSATGGLPDGKPQWSYSCHASVEECEAGRRIMVPTRGRRPIERMPVGPCLPHPAARP